MAKGIDSSHPTKSTLDAVKWLLGLEKKITNKFRAEVSKIMNVSDVTFKILLTIDIQRLHIWQ